MADAHGSGPCGSNTLWVRLPSSAGRKQEFPVWRFLFLCSFFLQQTGPAPDSPAPPAHPVLLRPSGRPPFLPLLPIFVPHLPLRPSFYESRLLPPIPHPVQEHRDMWFCAQSMWGQVSPVPAFPVGFSAVLTSVWRHARSSP